jgi:hypothetical protein
MHSQKRKIFTLFLLRSSTSKIIKVYDYFGWFASNLYTRMAKVFTTFSAACFVCVCNATSPKKHYLNRHCVRVMQ